MNVQILVGEDDTVTTLLLGVVKRLIGFIQDPFKGVVGVRNGEYRAATHGYVHHGALGPHRRRGQRLTKCLQACGKLSIYAGRGCHDGELLAAVASDEIRLSAKTVG